MCGFLTEFCFDQQEITPRHEFASLLELSIHRGPDATTIIQKPSFQLGFNRLAILDLSENGNQPMQSPSGRFHMVFNGEIYNYQELARKYKLTALNSTGDAAVIAHLLDVLSVDQLSKELNGMFAIAIVDSEDNRLYLIRDFAGIKPLFYGLSPKGIVAASQFDQIFKHSWFEPDLKLRPEVVKSYFAFGYMQAPDTVFENVFQVNPGQIVEIDSNGKIKIDDYRNFKTNVLKTPDKKLNDVLLETVKRQLISDVPIATFLSGGIDSPLITSYVKKNNAGAKALTIGVNDSNLNESGIAKQYAEAIQIDQDVVLIDEEDILNQVETHFKGFAEPFGDYSSIPTFVLTKFARNNYTVMLSGDGGDELYFGYPRMLDVLNKRTWFKLPYTIRKNLARVTNTLGITNSYAPYLKSIKAFVMNKHMQLPENILERTFKNIEYPEQVQTLYTFSNGSRKELQNELRKNEFYAHLQRVLTKVDRASMYNSLEVRVPFLDLESIEFAWQLSQELKAADDLKKPLKTELSTKVPTRQCQYKKNGLYGTARDLVENKT